MELEQIIEIANQTVTILGYATAIIAPFVTPKIIGWIKLLRVLVNGVEDGTKSIQNALENNPELMKALQKQGISSEDVYKMVKRSIENQANNQDVERLLKPMVDKLTVDKKP